MPPPSTESNKGGSVLVTWQKTRHSAHLEYILDIVLQHQGEDPMGKPTPLTCSISPTAMSPKRLITSRLTGAGSLLSPVYNEAWAKGNEKGIPRASFSSLRDATCELIIQQF
ncbi:hypothetical protein TNCV_13801 [Trichonephila clavipes]|nr:hypothetical protein TNCV_13801 [Trichonephila clavipes]